MLRKFFLIVLAGWLLTSCSSVHVQYDRQTDFSRYHTYAYQAGKNNIKGLQLGESQYIIREIDRHLRQWSLQPVRQNPDLLVKVILNFHKRVDVYKGYTPGPRRTQSKEGKVEVRLIDPRTSRIVWNGYFYLQFANERELKTYVRRKLDKMFRKMPPGINLPSSSGK